MLKHDVIRIKHMIDAAKEALSFAQGRTREGFCKDRMLLLSLIKDIEIIGEAASKVTGEFRSNHPEVPWAFIVAMRNRLIHGYFDIDTDRVWDTVNIDLPTLLRQLEGIVALKTDL